MLKILQARLQQYVNHEIPDVQAGFRKGRGTRDQIANIRWIMEKAREFQKNIYFCSIDYAKAFDCVDHNKPWKILQEMGIPDQLTSYHPICNHKVQIAKKKQNTQFTSATISMIRDWTAFQMERKSTIFHTTNLPHVEIFDEIHLLYMNNYVLLP